MKILYFIVCLFLFSTQSYANVDPSELKLNVYQIAVALDEDCSDPKVIFQSSSGVEKEFIGEPVIGSGSLPDGTYNCLMITMDDALKFTPNSSTTNCSAGTEYAIDICRDLASNGGSGNEHHSFTDLLEGTTITEDVECQGTSSDMTDGGAANKVTLYLRTNAPAAGGVNANYVSNWQKGIQAENAVAAGQPSEDTAHGLQLASPFIVSGAQTGVFYVDATGQVQDDGSGGCEMQAPEFGFRDE